ncbi:MAG TPA: 16S rRNA (uracil(1498)-N(3))-methyltransferase [Steroidobacteraceae bacterium]|nr:16S rRNA (uracil(1498)-N(3))-methyltransferase [Steroidobacteraceae bacterium]
MRLTRVYVDVPLGTGRTAELGGDAANHVLRVLRLRAGDALTLFDGRGGEYAARIAGMRRAGVTVEVGEHAALERESPLDLTLVQGMARGERTDFIIQKATELGVTRIVPVASERSVVRLEAEQARRKLAHWRAVAVAACEQCGRNRLPAIEEPRKFADALAQEADVRLLLDPQAGTPLAARVRGARRIALLVGPEGGFTDLETGLALRAGFQPSRTGPRVLRTETAAVAAIAAIQAIAGDLGTQGEIE